MRLYPLVTHMIAYITIWCDYPLLKNSISVEKAKLTPYENTVPFMSMRVANCVTGFWRS